MVTNRNGPVPIKDMQTPSPAPSEVAIFTWMMPTVINRIKYQFSDFYFYSYGWLHLQFSSLTNQKNKFSFKSGQILFSYISVEFLFMGSFYGFQKWTSTDIFWIEHDSLELHATRYFHTTS